MLSRLSDWVFDGSLIKSFQFVGKRSIDIKCFRSFGSGKILSHLSF